MPYRYLDDIAVADVAFEAWGATMEEMFTASADATMNVMVEDLATIQGLETLEIDLQNGEADLLLFNFLNELIFHKDARRLLLRVSALAISRHSGLFSLHAVLSGEEIDPARHQLNVDVKAVTLHRFRVEETGTGWKATVILDI
ncbi:MAG TPA: archease [Geobacteraceae bacterium]|nr:archease [Geobacteraceae bacterium]